jgi:hypothetical protein
VGLVEIPAERAVHESLPAETAQQQVERVGRQARDQPLQPQREPERPAV